MDFLHRSEMCQAQHHVIISGDVCLSGQANIGLAHRPFRSYLQAPVGSCGHSGTVNESLPEGSTRLKGWLPVQAGRRKQEAEQDQGLPPSNETGPLYSRSRLRESSTHFWNEVD